MPDLQTQLSYFLNGLYAGSVAIPANISVTGTVTATGNISSTGGSLTGVGIANSATAIYTWTGRTSFASPADGVVQFTNNAQNGFTRAIFGTNDATTSGAAFQMLGGQLVRRAGDGTTAAGQATVGPVTNGGTASIATFTVGASDGIFQVSADVSVTASSNHTFSIDCVYTDAASNSRTMLLPMEQLLTGNFISGALITNTLGVGAYASATMQIRAKAATTITLRTSAGGTFTGVVYTASATITQVG